MMRPCVRSSVPGKARTASLQLVGLLAAAIETENLRAVDQLLAVLSDEESGDVVAGAIRYLARIGSRIGYWGPWAHALHLQRWGQEAREAQARADTRIRALRIKERPAHPTRQELERAAFYLIRHGIRGLELYDRLDAVNLTYPEPLDRDVLNQAIRAAARHHTEVQNAVREASARVDALPSKPPRMFGRLRLLTVEETLAMPPRSYLLEGLVAPGDLSVWWGKPKSGKTFLVLRLAYGLAQGIGFWGREAEQVPVLYLSAEGLGGIAGRLAALHATLGPAPDFRLIAQPANLFDPEADLEPLIQAAKAIGARLVVLDTLARVLAGGDESSTRDMVGFVANCDRIREATSAHVAVVHHAGWDDSHSRGSNALIGAVDLSVKVSNTNGGRTGEVQEIRDEAGPPPLGFDLEVHELPPDAQGRPRTTCIAVDTCGTATGAAQAKLTDKAADLLRTMRNLDPRLLQHISPEPDMALCHAVSREILRVELIRQGFFPEDQLCKTLPDRKLSGKGPSTENNNLTSLRNKRFIGFNRGFAWLV